MNARPKKKRPRVAGPPAAGRAGRGPLGERIASTKALSSNVGTVGIEFVLSLVVGFFGGHWLDGRLGTGPYLTILGVCFGLAAGGRAIWRAAQHMRRDAEREEREEGNPKPLFESKREREERERDEREEQEEAARRRKRRDGGSEDEP